MNVEFISALYTLHWLDAQPLVWRIHLTSGKSAIFMSTMIEIITEEITYEDG